MGEVRFVIAHFLQNKTLIKVASQPDEYKTGSCQDGPSNQSTVYPESRGNSFSSSEIFHPLLRTNKYLYMSEIDCCAEILIFLRRALHNRLATAFQP